MGTHYDRGELVYEFDAYPDERFEGERLFFLLCARLFLVLSQQCYLSISGDVSEDAVSNPPSGKQATHMDIASKKQAEPSSSKQAVRVSAASKKQAEPSSSKQAVRVSAASKKQAEPSSSKKAATDVDVAEVMKLCASHMRSSVEKIEDTWLQRVNTEHTLQRSYKVSVSCCAMQPRTPMLMMSTMLLQSTYKEEQARRMELEARVQELTNTTRTITADRDHLKADRDTQRQTEATLMERLRMAEAMAHTNEQAITAVVKDLRGSLGAMQQAVQNALKESTEHLLSSFRTLIDEKLGAMQSVTSQLEPVTEEPVTEAQPAQEVLPELSKKVRL